MRSSSQPKRTDTPTFELQLVTSPKGKIEFYLSPRGHSDITAKFDVRGNTVRAAASEASVVPIDDADVRLDYEAPIRGRNPFGFHRTHRLHAAQLP